MTMFGVALLVACSLAMAFGDAGPLGRVLLLASDDDASRHDDPITDYQPRVRRSPSGGEDYADEGIDDPEGRTLHKLKRKLKPHKFGHHHGGFLGSSYPSFGGYPGLGGGCRKLHGCGGGHGWHKPHYGGVGGGGPIAAAFAGTPTYGGWNPGYGGGWNRPNAQSQFSTWNLGPFQGTFGLAHAG